MKVVERLSKHPLIFIITFVSSFLSLLVAVFALAGDYPVVWSTLVKSTQSLVNPQYVFIVTALCGVLIVITFLLACVLIATNKRIRRFDWKPVSRLPGRHLFQYEGYYPIDVAPDSNEPTLNPSIYVKALKYFVANEYDVIAAMDLVYLREDNKSHIADVLPREYEDLYEKLVRRYDLEYFRDNFSSDTERLFRNTIRIIGDLGETLKGVHFEVLLHDVRNPLRSIIAGSNLDVSKRRLYGPSTRFVVQYLKNQGKDLIAAMESGSKVAYPKQFNKTKTVKATTTPLFDERYGLVGILCLNIDIDAVSAMKPSQKDMFFRKYIETFGETPEFEKEHAPSC